MFFIHFSGLKRLQSIILGLGLPQISFDKSSITEEGEGTNTLSSDLEALNESLSLSEVEVDELLLGGERSRNEEIGVGDENDYGGEEGFYFR